MKCLWFGGWGLPREYTLGFARGVFPQGEHEVVLPTASCIKRTKTENADVLIGHSLGALLLLSCCQCWLQTQRVLLVAPIADFRAEAHRGGRVPRAKLRALIQWLRREPLAAVADFYRQAGLRLSAPESLPYAASELIWGIEQLASLEVQARHEVEAAWIGERDPLLDAESLEGDFPVLAKLPGAGHDLYDFREEVQRAL
ncbi:MAG: alpha/beta fold hydrolase [Verrucomicrobiota bacterium]